MLSVTFPTSVVRISSHGEGGGEWSGHTSCVRLLEILQPRCRHQVDPQPLLHGVGAIQKPKDMFPGLFPAWFIITTPIEIETESRVAPLICRSCVEVPVGQASVSPTRNEVWVKPVSCFSKFRTYPMVKTPHLCSILDDSIPLVNSVPILHGEIPSPSRKTGFRMMKRSQNPITPMGCYPQ